MGFSSAKTMFAGISTAGAAWELMARAMSAERGAAPTLMAATPLMRRLSANDMSGAISRASLWRGAWASSLSIFAAARNQASQQPLRLGSLLCPVLILKCHSEKVRIVSIV